MNKGWPSFMDRRVKERLVGATILVVLIVLIVPELLSGPKGRAPGSAAPAGPAASVRNVTVDLATSKATSMDDASGAASGAAAAGGDVPATNDAAGTALPGDTVSPNDAAASAAPVADAVPAEPLPAAADDSREEAGARPAPPAIATLKAQRPPITRVENAAPVPRSTALPAAVAPAASSRTHWAVQLGSFASRPNADKLVHRVKKVDSSAYVSAAGRGPQLRYRVRVGPMADRGAAERVLAKLRNEGLTATLVPP